MKHIILSGLFILLWSTIGQCGEIKAIVNDKPISEFDVMARAKMLMLQQTGRVGKMTETWQNEALEELIDEQIKLQEADKQNIQIQDEEIESALKHLEAQNNMPAGGLKKELAAQGVPYQTLVNQTKANLGWVRILHKEGKTVSVSAAEVQARQKMMRQALAKEAVSFAEIVVPTEEEALDIWTQLQNGTSFERLVDEKSAALSRTVGGRVLNVAPTYYGEEAAKILAQMPVGQLSRPIPVKGGYAVILMLNKRPAIMTDTVAVWELMQAVLSPDNPVNQKLSGKGVDSCDAFAKLAQPVALAGSFQAGQVSPEQLPDDVKNILAEAPVREIVGPVRLPDGLLYFMKCAQRQQRLIPTDEEIRMQIEGEKMDLSARQKLAELKRDVVVEYK